MGLLSIGLIDCILQAYDLAMQIQFRVISRIRERPWRKFKKHSRQVERFPEVPIHASLGNSPMNRGQVRKAAIGPELADVVFGRGLCRSLVGAAPRFHVRRNTFSYLVLAEGALHADCAQNEVEDTVAGDERAALPGGVHPD